MKKILMKMDAISSTGVTTAVSYIIPDANVMLRLCDHKKTLDSISPILILLENK